MLVCPPPSTVPPRVRRTLFALLTVVLTLGVVSPAAQAAPAQTAPTAAERAEAERLTSTLEARYAEMERLSERLNSSTEQAAKLARSVKASAKRLAELKTELATAQADLDRRARSAYITGPAGFLGPIVEAVSPQDAIERSRLVGSVLHADAAAVDRVSPAKAEAGRVAAAARRAAAEQQARVAAATAERRELEALTKRLE